MSKRKKRKKRKKTINSCEKGKAGEREAAKALVEALGISARRGQQHKGGPDSPDVLTSLEGVHIEVKRTETLSIYTALDQSKTERKPEEVPIVLHRRNRREWVAIVALEDLQRLAELIYLQTE